MEALLKTSSFRILVADNFEPWRRFVSSMLQNRPGLQVVGEAIDGLEAIQKASELQADLIVLDLTLSRLNGLEVAKRIIETLPTAKILFATQNLDTDVAKAALSNGASGYLLKVDAGSELLPAIDAVLRGEQFLSRSVRRKASLERGNA